MLHDLTGAPIKHLYFNLRNFDHDNEWNYLIEASQKEYAMVASSRPGSDTEMSPSGVVQGHAYTFHNATYVKVNPGRGGKPYEERIVQLRNPWGSGESHGRWADNDCSWNQVSVEEKKRLGYNPEEDDGIFFMSY